MSHAQLPLIEALPPVSFGSAPVRGRRNALALTCDRHRAALQRLVQGPAPLDQIAQVAGEPNAEKLALELRALGLDVPTVPIPTPTLDSQPTCVVVCSLSKHDVRKILQYVKKQERKNE